MFRRILIANRGEIARRIQLTARRLGVETVAVYSDADADAGFVRNADRAVRIGPPSVAESYLNSEAIIDAALAQGAQAIHPGYGFVAENAAFAQAVADAGLTFIGPAPATIALMGSKTDAKSAMEDAGIDGVPGYHGQAQDDERLAREADAIGFPVLIKASAGGGGKGMRVATGRDQFADACDGARREAASAFGDDRLLLEKFIDRPRHIEVQIVGDHHGQIVHLFERECSVQRRYQKIIEEAPSPTLSSELRARMTQTAVRAASAVDYRGAGTIEFIVTPNDEFYFMEMNTRLQVEHPVTEAITGIDLVEWQLRIAAGEALPVSQDGIVKRGHAIECRVYAEDPFAAFVPSSGTLQSLVLPGDDAVRIDIDLVEGQAVSTFYDPMIAKLTVHGETRDDAIAVMSDALDRTSIVGPASNIALLRLLMRHADYRGGRIDTAYLDRQLDTVLDTFGSPPIEALAAVCAVAAGPSIEPLSPWAADGWQANGIGARRFALATADGAVEVCTMQRRSRKWSVEHNGRRGDIMSVTHDANPREVIAGIDVHGVQHSVHVLMLADAWRVTFGDTAWELRRAPLYRVVRADASDDNRPGAPMPGRIVKLLVGAGDAVVKGQPLVVMEGMKMELTIAAARDGTVKSVNVEVGDQVEADVPLVELIVDDKGDK